MPDFDNCPSCGFDLTTDTASDFEGSEDFINCNHCGIGFNAVEHASQCPACNKHDDDIPE